VKDFEFCDRVGKWYRPCDWTTVSDYKGPSKALKRHADLTWDIPLPMAELLIETETYVGAFCQTCGKFIKKDGTDGTE
jgi:hypothetical protein